jgi:hypothetical protein
MPLSPLFGIQLPFKLPVVARSVRAAISEMVS